MTIWLDGNLLASGTAAIDPADRGLTLGDGLFETIRVGGGAARWLDRHLARLRQGAGFLEIPVPLDDAALTAAIATLLAAEGLRDGALRLTLTRGPAARGLLPPTDPRPTLLMTAGAVPPAAPVAAVVATQTRRNELSPLARIKSLNALDNILARREAARRGAGDALLLNTAGRLAEASAANLFLLLDGAWTTPPVAEGALPGIMRGLLIERCGAVERMLPPAALQQAEAGFLSNSLGLRPLASVDGVPLGKPGIAPVAELSRRLDLG